MRFAARKPVFRRHLKDRVSREDLRAAIQKLDELGSGSVDADAYVSLLRQCSGLKALAEGKSIHAHIAKAGYDRDRFLGNLLIQMYGNCGSIDAASRVFSGMQQPNEFSWNTMIAAYAQNGHLQEARNAFERMPESNVVSWNAMLGAYVQHGQLQDASEMFNRMPERDVVSWNVMITAYARNGLGSAAFELYQGMDLDGVQPNEITVVSILEACASRGALEEGKIVHFDVVDTGLQSEVSVVTGLVNMYGRCGSVDIARSLFDQMVQPDVVAWTAMVTAYAQNGHLQEAMRMFNRMPERNMVSWNAILTAYAQHGHLRNARYVFDAMPQQNLVSWTAMVASYAQSGHHQDAKELFERMPYRDVVAWNVMITAYTQNGHSKEALELLHLMGIQGVQPDRVSFINAIDACASLADMSQARIVHAVVNSSMFKSDVGVETAIISMYGKCGSLEDAEGIFNNMAERNVVSWTALVAAFAHNGHLGDARVAFERMPERNVVSWNAVVAGYARNGQLQEAKSMFEATPDRDVISWSIMVAAYAKSGYKEDAMKLFNAMGLESVQPNKVTFINVLETCSGDAALAAGKAIHARIVESGFELDVSVGTALVTMYGNCGSLRDAGSMFERMPELNVVSWNAMITAYAQNGHPQKALELFHIMGVEGVEPNEITLVSVLAVCSHAGWLFHGWQYFVSMGGDHGIAAQAEHYACMIDLLGRAGELEGMEDLISSMPFEADDVVWTALLGACRVHGDIERGASAAARVARLDPEMAVPYVMLSNMYSGGGRRICPGGGRIC